MSDLTIYKRPSPYGLGKQDPKKLIIHAMGQFIIIDEHQAKYFKAKGKNIPAGIYHASEFLERRGFSAHLLQEPDGSFIKLRSTAEGAYHAKGENSDSVGIEVLVEGKWHITDFDRLMKSDKDWVTPEQYQYLVPMTQEIIDYWPRMTAEDVCGHSDVSPGRKFDPGKGFKMEWFKGQLK